MKLYFEVQGDEFVDVGKASSKVKKMLKQLGLSASIIRKVTVSMYEAEINMVIHANGGVVEGELCQDYIVLYFKDYGPGIENVSKAMEVGYSTASEEAREMGFGAGMGLPNIERYSDKLEIKTEIGVGTTVMIKVNFS